MAKRSRRQEAMQYVKDNLRKIAYFSMEIGINQEIRTYGGGLGVLAGDTIRSAADLGIPMVAVTLLYRKGYLHQRLDSDGWQIENPDEWSVEDFLKELPNRISLRIEGRYVYIRAWRYEVAGVNEATVPILFLDADLPENAKQDRLLTHCLYGGSEYDRLAQEKILGIGGVRMLRNLGYIDIERYHMNEGHSSLLTLELLDIEATKRGSNKFEQNDLEAIRNRCVFTTHTPVHAGHDIFSLDLVERVMKRPEFKAMPEVFCFEGKLNMTYLAMNLSRYINGVAKKHGEVSRMMFKTHTIDSITNGVHVAHWTSDYMKEVFDEHLPGWSKDNYALRYALNIPCEAIWNAHLKAKGKLIALISETASLDFDPQVLTIGFARRFTGYKRGDLIFHDISRLKRMAEESGGIQIVFGGKAHPQDRLGKEIIQKVFHHSQMKNDQLKIVFLPDYDIEMAKILIPGVDLWLNTPEAPLEASGTSGMKAAVNGIPSLSVLDGWWIEGHVEGITGWSIGEDPHGKPQKAHAERDAESLYQKLRSKILPLFYKDLEHYQHVMRNSISLNGAFFNTQRMIQEYVLKAYYL
jgi:glycogen phosphorylase